MVITRLFSQLRHRPRSLSALSPPSLTRHLRHATSLFPSPPPRSPSDVFFRSTLPIAPSTVSLWRSSSFHHSRPLSSTSMDSDHSEMNPSPDPLPQFGGDGSSVIGGSEDFFLPVRIFISLLDGFHDLTGLPWWIVIASSTLALRLVLLPLLVLQIHKLKRMSELFPKLPPPFPPPRSGRSYADQIFLHFKERKALGCPSYLWFPMYFSVQVPSFFLWMISIRKMSVDHHPGFECGGALWFQNLTALPYGSLGAILPLLVGGLYYTSVQLSFRSTSIGNVTGLLQILLKFYKYYLDLLAIPTIIIGLCVPQGTLVYWVTNATFTVVQQLFLQNTIICKRLGLLDSKHPTEIAHPNGIESEGTTSSTPLKTLDGYSLQNLSHQELVDISVKLLEEGQIYRAIPLLQLALDKDPEYTKALVLLGWVLLHDGLLAEAREYLEHAISKLTVNHHHQLEVAELDLLILAFQCAGISCIKQGKKAEGIMHLQRLANLEEPDNPMCKSHYFDGLLLLGSALYDEGRRAEAVKFARLVVSYNPAHMEFLELCEGEDKFVSDLVNSRRDIHHLLYLVIYTSKKCLRRKIEEASRILGEMLKHVEAPHKLRFCHLQVRVLYCLFSTN